LGTPTALDRIGWAIRAPIDDATVWRTLVILANHADDAGLAYPKAETIAGQIRRADRQTRAALETLEADGFLQRLRVRSGGRLRGYLYRLTIPGAVAIDPETLPAFAAEIARDLPAAWLAPIPTSGDGPPVPTGDGPPVHKRRPAAGQEPPTVGTAQGEPSTSVVPTDASDEVVWPDEVVTLTREFAQMVKQNGHALPGRGTTAATGWLREMERLLRIGPPGDTGDDPPPDVGEVRDVMRWALTVSDFWPANVRSVPKFREQYTTLRAQMRRPNGRAPGPALADGYAAAAEALRSRR
jgi:hypothetical protein